MALTEFRWPVLEVTRQVQIGSAAILLQRRSREQPRRAIDRLAASRAVSTLWSGICG